MLPIVFFFFLTFWPFQEHESQIHHNTMKKIIKLFYKIEDAKKGALPPEQASFSCGTDSGCL